MDIDRPIPEYLIAKVDSIREYMEGYPVEFWVNPFGRVVIRSYSECGNAYTEIDLNDILDWCRGENGRRALIPALPNAS